MGNINVRFNNKDYLLSCDDGQEENLKKLANHLDLKYSKVKKNLGNLGESKLLLIAAIQMADDYFELFQKVKETKNDFESLSTKFKELKTLAIRYKEEKDLEIDQLKKELNDFKIMAEKSQNSFEEILDKTTKSKEKFIENTETKQ